jgi:RNA polymerase sigma-70 factor (ECF subfamily)
MTEFPETRSTLLHQIRSPADREAWEEFTLIYKPVMYRMARRRGMQDADAQDLVQTVLVQVSGAIARWEKGPEKRFRHWLRRVIKNAIITALTRRPKDIAVGGSDIQDFFAARCDADLDVEQELRFEHKRELYLRAASNVQSDVSTDTWYPFELTVIEGKTCSEAAALTGKSVGTVYAARSRVMRRIRDEVKRLEQSDS